MKSSVLVALLFIFLILFITLKILKKIKFLKLDAITIINGGVKCGKTTLAVYLAHKRYKTNMIRFYIRSFFQKLFKMKVDEKPLFYSNIPVAWDYVPLTYDLILRTKRFSYKSVVLMSESSLLIGSMDFRNDDVNEKITLFIKLFGHETRGGSLFIETQCINDNHYAIKRGINRYIWIESLVKTFPFILVYKVREMAYMDGESSISNTFINDVEDHTKTLIIFKSIWRKFDCYCYSKMTDSLDVYNDIIYGSKLKSLKIDKLLRFKNYKKELKNEKV